MSSSSYDPKLFNIFFGTLHLQGFGDGTKIEVNWLSDGAQAQAGVDGDAVVIRTHDQRAEVTIELMATGAGRNTLAALMTYYNQIGVSIPLVITSIDTGEVFRAPVATMKKPPNMSADANMPKRSVTFVCPKADLVVAPDPLVPFQAL